MQDTSGFYKYENGNNLLYAPNGVVHCDYSLSKTNIFVDDLMLSKILSKLPLQDGWYWFDSEDDAKVFFGIVDEPPQAIE